MARGSQVSGRIVFERFASAETVACTTQVMLGALPGQRSVCGPRTKIGQRYSVVMVRGQGAVLREIAVVGSVRATLMSGSGSGSGVRVRPETEVCSTDPGHQWIKVVSVLLDDADTGSRSRSRAFDLSQDAQRSWLERRTRTSTALNCWF